MVRDGSTSFFMHAGERMSPRSGSTQLSRLSWKNAMTPERATSCGLRGPAAREFRGNGSWEKGMTMYRIRMASGGVPRVQCRLHDVNSPTCVSTWRPGIPGGLKLDFLSGLGHPGSLTVQDGEGNPWGPCPFNLYAPYAPAGRTMKWLEVPSLDNRLKNGENGDLPRLKGAPAPGSGSRREAL